MYEPITKNLSQAAGIELALDWLERTLAGKAESGHTIWELLGPDSQTSQARTAGFCGALMSLIGTITDPGLGALEDANRDLIAEMLPEMRQAVADTIVQTDE